MSFVSEIQCDAPKCTVRKKQSNHWWILRKSTTVGGFVAFPMQDTTPSDDDKHICGTPCMHSALEEWMQAQMTQSAEASGPRCTCNDTYEVGSGNRCPVHEIYSVGMKLRKEINDRERTRIAAQAENNRREEERINRPA